MKQFLPFRTTNSTFMCEKLSKYFSIFWVLLLVTTMAFAQGGGGPGKSDYDTGEKNRKAGQFKEAVDAYERAINAEPNNDKYWFRKAQALAQMKDAASMDAAINSFKKTIELNPNLSAAYYMLYKLYTKQKKYDDALKNIRLAFEKEADQDRKVNYKVQETKLLLQLDKNAEALTALSAAIAIRPRDMKVLGMQGEIYLRDGKYDQASESFQKAYKTAEEAKRRKDMGYYKMKMAYAYYRGGKNADYDREKADLGKDPGWKVYERKLNQLVKGDNAPSKDLKLARAYVGVNDFDEAKKYINNAINSGKNLTLAYRMLAIVHTKAGETKQAVTALNKAASSTTEKSQIDAINSQMVKLQINNQDYDGALQTVNKLGDQKNPTLKYYKAIAEYKVQRYSDCILTLESLASGSKAGSEAANAKYYFLMGLAAKKANQNQKALDAFKKAEFGSFKAAAQAEIQALSGK